MTAVVAFNSVLGGVTLVADTRLTSFGPQNQILRLRDVCRKLLVATPWCVVGFAGALCPARTLMSGIIKRVRDYPTDDMAFMVDGTLDWLRQDQALGDYLGEGFLAHAQTGDEHVACLERPVELLIAWTDPKPWAQGTAPYITTKTIKVRLLGIGQPIDIRRKPWGFELIGRGAVGEPALDTPENFNKIANTGWDVAGAGIKGMMVAEMLRHEMRVQGEQTVGGLYQIAHLSTEGVRQIPYFYWARVTPGHGTFVAMRLENGRWVQHHRPSGTLRVVHSPFDPALTQQNDVAAGTHEMFEPSLFLTADSPGVLPTPAFGIAYVQYNPAHVPADVLASWGPESLPPSSGEPPGR